MAVGATVWPESRDPGLCSGVVSGEEEEGGKTPVRGQDGRVAGSPESPGLW
jgi:hypothetical protein